MRFMIYSGIGLCIFHTARTFLRGQRTRSECGEKLIKVLVAEIGLGKSAVPLLNENNFFQMDRMRGLFNF